MRLGWVLLIAALGTAAPAQNLVLNGGFERVDAAGRPRVWNWSAGAAGGAAEVVTDHPHSGERCLKLSSPTPRAPHVFSHLSQTLRLAPGVTHTLSYQVRSSAAGDAFVGGGPDWLVRLAVPDAGDTWRRVSVSFQAPAEDRAWELLILIEDESPGLYIDDVQLEEGDQATDFAEAGPLGPGQLAVRLVTLGERRNLLPNPSFEDGGEAPTGWLWEQRNTDARMIVDDTGHFGRRAVRITNGTPFGAHVYSLLRLPEELPVDPGTVYTFSAWVRTDGNPGTAWFGGGQAWLQRTAIPNTQGRWQRIQKTFTTGPERSIPVMICTESPTAGFWIDDVQLERGALATPFVGDPNLPPQVALSVDSASEPARWKPDLYPPGEVIFVADELRLEGAVSLPEPRRGTLRVTIADGARTLAERTLAPTAPLPPGGLVPVAFGLPEPAPERLTATLTLADAGGVLAEAATSLRVIPLGAIGELVDEAASRLPALRARAAGDDDCLVTATVIENFLGFIRDDLDAGQLGRAYDQALNLRDLAVRAEAAPNRGRAPRYVTSPIAIDGGGFTAEVRRPDGTTARQPVYFLGYGHFAQVRRDVEKLPGYGQNILQIEFGPNSVFPAEDQESTAAVDEFLAVCDRAAASGVAVNLLLSPHYLPTWVIEKWPHLAGVDGGFLRYSVYAPESRQVLERFLRLVIPRIKDHPALHSLCLSNEPLTVDARACGFFADGWRDWLRARYGTIAAVNARWRTDLADFAAVEVPAPEFAPSARTCDLVRYQQEAFAGWHRWMADVIHSMAPDLPVHAKIMIGAHFGRSLHGFWSIAPELFGELSQINGNDCWKPPGASETWACGWLAENMGYDYQRSAADRPVFNSENHNIPDRTMGHVTPEYIRNVYWQGAIHGQGAETTWVWERAFDPRSDFAGSILHRPECVVEKGLTALDLMRAAREVAAIAGEPARLAILWSQTAAIWDGDAHERAVRATYTAANFLDQTVGFVNDRDAEAYAAGRGNRAYDAAELILVPHAVHVPAEVVAALRRFAAGGGRVVYIGPAPERDDADAPLAGLPDGERWPDELATGEARALHARLTALAPRPIVAIGAYGVEARSARLAGGRVVNLCDYLNTPATVRLPAGCVDVLTGERLGDELALTPLVPRLVRCEGD